MTTGPFESVPIAIVGMACRLPGAEDLDQFWRLVREGRSAFGPAPAHRFNRELYYDPRRGVQGKSYTDLVGAIHYRPADRRVLPVPEETLAKFDIAHVTLCETAAAACRHAGMDPMTLPYRHTGVYVGHAAGSELSGQMTYATEVAKTARYLREVAGFDRLEGGGDQILQEIIEQVRHTNPHHKPDGSPYLGASVAPGLIASLFGLSGPYMAFNAACASSLQALAQAVRALQLGRIDMAIVGGASCFTSDTLVLFSAAQSVTVSGSFPFTADADGMVVSEGCVVLLLKTLERALADKDRICAIIPSIGLSSDGHGRSLWAPRPEGQIEAIRRAYQSIPLNSVQYIEAHATSTALGDVTEIQALSRVLQAQLPSQRKIPIGSVKFNIGHTLESAGLAGVLKTVLSLQNRIVPPTTDGRRLNPQVDWDTVPVFVPQGTHEWPTPGDGGPRRAGVNSFGIGGLNAHVVLEEFRPPRTQAVAVGRPVASSLPHAPASNGNQAVAIVGMGAVLPGARTLEAFWDLLVSSRDARSEVPPERWDPEVYHQPGMTGPWTTPTTLGGFVTGFEYDWRKHRIPPKQIAQASPLQFMILDAVDQAFHQAGYVEKAFDRKRVGVVVGTVFGGDFSSQLVMGLRLPEFQKTAAEVLRRHGLADPLIRQWTEAYAGVLLKHMPALLDETGSFTSSALASRITKAFDLMGGAVAVDAGNASSLAALSCCVDQLLSGTCDMMVCVGGQQDMTAGIYTALGVGGSLAPERPHAPFDAEGQGLVPGEGCGAVLLKRLADARRDGDHIYGIIRGIGAANSPDCAEAMQLAIERARSVAQIDACDIALLETAGRGKADLDREEVQAIQKAYQGLTRTEPIQLGTVVGQIGHTGGASGMASLLTAVLALEHQEVPAAAELKSPLPLLTRGQSILQASTQRSALQPQSGSEQLLAAVNSCGGFDAAYHVLIERGAKVKSSRETSNLAGAASAKASSRIIHYDATVRRRDKMRSKAGGIRMDASLSGLAADEDSKVATPIHPLAVSVPREPVALLPGSNGSSQAPRHAGNGTPTATNGVPASAPVTPAVAAIPAPAAPPAASSNGRKVDTKELEAFLVSFVVEQTGYPPSIVELDADLEADLGIDSIKKAHLFGDLGEYFKITAAADMSLDDFPTLRHVLNYLVKRLGAASAANGVPAPAPVAPAVAAIPATAAPPASSNDRKVDAKELEAFLVNFVVEQTGYPASIVELDADLEADLGIDSIKKAHLFGDLGEYFKITAAADMTFDDFPTLRHVLNYLVKRLGAAPAAANGVPAPAPVAPAVAVIPAPAAPPAASSNGRKVDTKELEAFLVNFVVEQTGYPASIVELDADLEADLGIDSIKKAHLFGDLGEYFKITAAVDMSLDDFPTLRHVLNYLVKRLGAAAAANGVPAPAPVAPAVAVIPAPAAPPAAPSNGRKVDTKELEAFLVNFVVEQTGYPSSIVELDADLEADLGIDSIKKAHLFGDLGEYFKITVAADMSLDDFPTLRHVLNYLVKRRGAGLQPAIP